MLQLRVHCTLSLAVLSKVKLKVSKEQQNSLGVKPTEYPIDFVIFVEANS